MVFSYSCYFTFPTDLDELAVHCLQYSLILHSGTVLQRLLSHLLLALQPLLDHAEASAGPPLLPALCHHTCGCVAAQVNCQRSLFALRHKRICQIFLTQAMTDICTACLSCLSQGSGVHLALFGSFTSQIFLQGVSKHAVSQPSPIWKTVG